MRTRRAAPFIGAAPALRGRASFALVLLCTAAAHAQTTRPPLTQNDFNLDLVNGPVLGSGRIVGLGGAYTALAAGVEGAGWNPAAYASRGIWETDWLEWNGALNLIPSMIKNSDFDNNGENGFTYDNFIFATFGLGLQFGQLGVGALINVQTYEIAKTAELDLVTANVGAGYAWLDGQLVIGAGARVAVLSISDVQSNHELVSLSGASPEAGVVLRPAGQRWRFGAAARLPVVSGDAQSVLAAGLTLPREIRLPFEAQAGFAVQLGPRPLNRKWVNPHDLEKRLRDEMLAARRARAHQEWKEEQMVARMQLSRERGLPSLAELQPDAEVSFATAGAPSDPEWLRQETERRWDEERELLTHLAELKAEREAEVRALSRRFLLLSADAIAVGPTDNGVGLESFLSQQRQNSGEHFTIGLRFGIEGEPISHWLQMRAGTYLEPSRFAGVGYRVHGTLGTDVRLFSWNFFGVFDEFTLRFGASADVAERYLNAGFGIGLWH